MKSEPGNARAANLLLPFALFGFLAPIATYLVAMSNFSPERKTVVLAVLAGSYALLFAISYKRLRATVNKRLHFNVPDGEAARFRTTPTGDDETANRSFLDARTGLANDQGFQMVLDHELAECMRNPDDRQLSVLAVDICDLALIEEQYGLAVRDRVLVYAAEKVQSNLRAMDFAACVGDGFTVVLPTAGESGAVETSLRIESAFAETSFKIADDESLTVRVLIGSATFSPDRDTAELLIGHAVNRKREANANARGASVEKESDYLH